MKSRVEQVTVLQARLSERSNLNAEVLHDTSTVISRAADVLASAQKLQVLLFSTLTIIIET